MNRLMNWLGVTSAAIAAGLFAASPALSATMVGTELVLSVDVSDSIDSDEYILQQQGYVDAFRNTDFIEIVTGIPGGVAVTLQMWSTNVADSIGWYHITDAASANAFADAIEAIDRPEAAKVGTGTNIAAALTSAAALLDSNDFIGRQVIDISGDGRQNVGAGCNVNNQDSSACTSLVESARDVILAQDITINGLPVLADVPDLDNYFQQFVTGGEDSFIQIAAEFEDFNEAISQKVQREVTAVPEPSVTLGLLALGLLCGGSMLKKQQERA
ncbi:MAG: DUF1194 domain-containing protein [Cyanobacteria bacterium SBLK]|nr:DUF1194 domain-containing protein [Cyanobacteria bacterium SBLK]